MDVYALALGWTLLVIYASIAVAVSVFLLALGFRLNQIREARRLRELEKGAFIGDFWTREWTREPAPPSRLRPRSAEGRKEPSDA